MNPDYETIDKLMTARPFLPFVVQCGKTEFKIKKRREIHVSTVANYMRLGRNRAFLEQNLDLSEIASSGRGDTPSIKSALRLLSKRDKQAAEEAEPALPAEFEEPLLILRDQLKSYVYQQFQLTYLAEQIHFRIKTEKLGRRQIRQAVEWATQEHLELRDMILKAFLR